MKPVLVCVEDDHDLLEILTEEFRDHGHDVVVAYDGLQGYTAAIEHKPAAVIADIDLPTIDGATMVQRLRANNPDLADIPVIVVSAFADDVKARGTIDAAAYFTKPVDYDALIKTVEDLVTPAPTRLHAV